MTEHAALQAGNPAPELTEAWNHVLLLPCQLSVDLAIAGFRVGQLLQLKVGSILRTACEEHSNLPVLVNGQIIGWGEFQVIEPLVAIHLLELI